MLKKWRWPSSASKRARRSCLEISWLLHHDIDGEDMQMWLYGTNGGSHWPKCEIYDTNYDTHAVVQPQVEIDFGICLNRTGWSALSLRRPMADGAPSPVPAEQSLQVMKILNGIYESEKTGREVLL